MVQGKNVTFESLQAIFIYKFTMYIEWPSEKGKIFKIGVLNNKEMYLAIKDIFQGKLIRNRPVYVVNLSNLDKKDKYNILHIKKIDQNVAYEVRQLQHSGLLTVTQDDQGLAEEALINFYIEKTDKLRFEINNERSYLHDLKINSRLLNLSRRPK